MFDDVAFTPLSGSELLCFRNSSSSFGRSFSFSFSTDSYPLAATIGTNSGTSGFKLSPIDDDMLSDSLSLPGIEPELFLVRKVRGSGGGGIEFNGSATGKKSGCELDGNPICW